MKILIVEDSKFTRALLRRELATEHDVLEAANGSEGLEILARDGADLVLVDLLMPQMDGFEFLQRVREGGSSVPVVVCSANTQPSVEARIHELGGTAFVAKPELLVKGRALALAAKMVAKDSEPRPRLADLMEQGLLEKALEAAESVLSRITGLPVNALLSASIQTAASNDTAEQGFDVVMELSGRMEGTSSVRLLGEGVLNAAVKHLGLTTEQDIPSDVAGELGNLMINAFVARFAEISGHEVAFSGPVTTGTDMTLAEAETDAIRIHAQFEVVGITEPVGLSLSLSPNAFKEVVARLRSRDGITA